MNTQNNKQLENDIRRTIGKVLDQKHTDLISAEIMELVISHVGLSRLYQEKGIYSEKDISAAIGYALMERLEVRYPTTLYEDILKVVEELKPVGCFSIGLAKEAEKELLAMDDFHTNYWSTITAKVKEIQSRYKANKEDATLFSVKDFIYKKGWQTEIFMKGNEDAMNVSILFDNNGTEDRIDFNIEAFNTSELNELFSEFCKEENCEENSVLGIWIERVADGVLDLQLLEEREA